MKNTRKPDMRPKKTEMQLRDAGMRVQGFDEVALGYTAEQAVQEANRCLNCPERYCSEHCPAHSYIPEFIAEIRNRDFEAAYRLISRTNSMMGISGRVCPCENQCESHCTRGIRGEPVAIGALERFVSDWHDLQVRNSTRLPEGIKGSAAVVGSGPAGLTCAISLAMSGVRVTVFERTDRIGGVISWGIPSFELPAHLLESKISELKSLCVDFQMKKSLGKDFTLAQLKEKYDAVFLAVGACIPVESVAVGANIPGVIQAAHYLAEPSSVKGKCVAVIGGGNTALNAARSALRMGASEVKLLYRRTRAELPATEAEIRLALEEGVKLIPLVSPIEFVAENGVLRYVECSVMELSAPDYPGGRPNSRATGRTVMIKADVAILALGFKNEQLAEVEQDESGRVIVDEKYATSVDGVYAGGDSVLGPSTLMKASAAGKNAAANIFEAIFEGSRIKLK